MWLSVLRAPCYWQANRLWTRKTTQTRIKLGMKLHNPTSSHCILNKRMKLLLVLSYFFKSFYTRPRCLFVHISAFLLREYDLQPQTSRWISLHKMIRTQAQLWSGISTTERLTLPTHFIKRVLTVNLYPLRLTEFWKKIYSFITLSLKKLFRMEKEGCKVGLQPQDKSRELLTSSAWPILVRQIFAVNCTLSD